MGNNPQNFTEQAYTLIIHIPELFTYALYIVIAFVLEVIYLAITLLFVLLGISYWCTYASLVYLDFMSLTK
jgi:ABC-type dipeptide/oligopeptide/nickel transport system permease subunit